MINLTAVKGHDGQPSGPVRMKAAELLAYEQETTFTRLRLRGAKWLDVKEGTDEIDRLIREAASAATVTFS